MTTWRASYFSPLRSTGSCCSVEPRTMIFELGDFASSSVASMPRHFRIEMPEILWNDEMPPASISFRSASLCSRFRRNS